MSDVKKQQDEIQAFLTAIGPRALTDAEAKELHLMRIRAGKGQTMSGVIEKLAREADEKSK